MSDGDVGDFHLSNVKRLAKVTNDPKATSKEDSDIGGITPNKAVTALGSNGFPTILNFNPMGLQDRTKTYVHGLPELGDIHHRLDPHHYRFWIV